MKNGVINFVLLMLKRIFDVISPTFSKSNERSIENGKQNFYLIC